MFYGISDRISSEPLLPASGQLKGARPLGSDQVRLWHTKLLIRMGSEQVVSRRRVLGSAWVRSGGESATADRKALSGLRLTTVRGNCACD